MVRSRSDFLILLIFNITVCKSQVGINTATPDASSALDIESTDGGILIPRMTTSQKTAIVDPANSLMLYDTDLKQYQYNEGTTSTPNWRAILSDAVKRDNYKVIKSTADLQDELVAGGGSSYLLSSNFFYEVSGTITIDYPIDINDAYLAGLDVGEDVLVNATGGTLFQSTSSGGSLRNLTLNGNNNQLFNVSGDGSQQFTFHTCIMAGASSVGSFSNLGLVFFDLIDFVNEFNIPKFPEKYLRRRSIAQPILKRTTTLGELVSQLESIAEVIETQDLLLMKRKRNKKYSDKALISQVKSLAHREKLPETTKALGKFIEGWEKALQWTDFEYLVKKWQTVVKNDLDKDRLGVFWALLFLSSENKIEIKQINSLYGPIQIKRIIPDGGLAQLPIENLEVSNASSSAA